MIKSFEQLENEILANNPILRFKGLYKKSKGKTIQEFIKKFFKEFNTQFNTVNVDTKQIVCDTNRRRSLGDIYMTCKYYFPECELVDIFAELEELCDSTYGFRSSWCTTIEKRVYYYSTNQANAVYNLGKEDEYGLVWKSYQRFLLQEPAALVE